ncbi:MAG: TonB-dependent receptor [Bacteroidaceae bacterium]|nr:TonB-dependent receptor [Bacteroidaceae bacterium]
MKNHSYAIAIMMFCCLPLTAQDITKEYDLQEVQVTAKRHDFGALSSQMSANSLSLDQIKKLPMLLGEIDVLKSLQQLPGVQSSGEGRAGIYVRGGDYDQNLFLIDGINLYNPQHLQGFTSAINADMLEDVVLYKGAFPTSFGSRLSGVIDMGLREGNKNRYHATIAVGMLASRIQLEGPIWKNHTSFNVAARASYFNAIVRPLLAEVVYDNPGAMNAYSNMKYFDINAKLSHRFTDNDKLSAIFYYGRDVNNANPTKTEQSFRNDIWIEPDKYRDITWGLPGYSEKTSWTHTISESVTTNRWHNLLGGLQYTHTFTPSMKLNASASYSGYDYQLHYDTFSEHLINIDLFDSDPYRWEMDEIRALMFSRELVNNGTYYKSKVHDWSGKIDFSLEQGGKHIAHAGVQANSIKVTSAINAFYKNWKKAAHDERILWHTALGDDRYKITERSIVNNLVKSGTLSTIAAYIEDDWSISSWLRANVGLRWQGYQADGKFLTSFEPRASLRWLMAKGTALKISYARMSQGLFLLTSGNLVTPSEIWIAFNKDMQLGRSDQLSVGFNYDTDNGIQFSVEGYYKKLDNVVDYAEGTSFIAAKNIHDLVVQGKGRAYGVEVMLEKTMGKTKGHISYTWSKSLRTFDRPGMVLNGGREFYANGDRRHNIHFSIVQRLSKNWDFSAAWTYQSGRRASIATTTIGTGQLDEYNNYMPHVVAGGALDLRRNPAYSNETNEYYLDTDFAHVVRMDSYSQRNSFVFPAVHRLDVSLIHHGSIGIGEMICEVGIYNLYNQQNISSVYWGYKDNRRSLKGVCMFPIMPSLSLTLKL